MKRTLFSEGTFGLREGCTAIVVEMTGDTEPRLGLPRKLNGVWRYSPPAGWKVSPMPENPEQPAYFTGAYNGCNNEGLEPLGDLPGALTRPGSFYRIINHGEGIAIIVPRAKLAGYFYFG